VRESETVVDTVGARLGLIVPEALREIDPVVVADIAADSDDERETEVDGDKERLWERVSVCVA